MRVEPRISTQDLSSCSGTYSAVERESTPCRPIVQALRHENASHADGGGARTTSNVSIALWTRARRVPSSCVDFVGEFNMGLNDQEGAFGDSSSAHRGPLSYHIGHDPLSRTMNPAFSPFLHIFRTWRSVKAATRPTTEARSWCTAAPFSISMSRGLTTPVGGNAFGNAPSFIGAHAPYG